MSLSEDLARHRKVFEMLTSSGAPDEEAAPMPEKRLEPSDYTEPEAALAIRNSAPQTVSAPQKIYSLKRGASASTGMALSFEAPDTIEYPELDHASSPAYSDPLEPLYHRLDVESRLESQLLSEEEF